MVASPMLPPFDDKLLGQTTMLTAEQLGCYFMILFETWKNGCIPFADDPAELAMLCRISPEHWETKVRPKLMRYFDLKEGTWFHFGLAAAWFRRTERAAAWKANGQKSKGRPQKKPKGIPNNNPMKTQGDTQGVFLPTGQAPPIDPKQVVFTVCLKQLQDWLGKSEQACRAWLGKAAGKYGDGNVIEAFSQVAARGYRVDPVAALTEQLERMKNGNGHKNGRSGLGAGEARDAVSRDAIRDLMGDRQADIGKAPGRSSDYH